MRRRPAPTKKRTTSRSRRALTPKVNVLIEDDRWATALPRLVTLTRRFATLALETEDRAKAETTVVLSTDSVVRGLNRRFRQKDSPTNVLAFPAARVGRTLNPAKTAEIGEIILAFETVRKEAVTQGKPFVNHLAHLVIHGILHLLGYDHEAPGEARVMERLEADILSMLGMPNPYGGGRPHRG